MKNKIALGILLTITLMFYSMVNVAALTEKDLTINIQGGIEQQFRFNISVPFKISIENKGESFKGELQIYQINKDFGKNSRYGSSENISNTTYAKKIEMPNSSSKDFIINYPIYSTLDRKFKISLVVDDEVIKTTTYTLKLPFRPEITTIGILSSEKSGFDYLSSINFFSGNNRYQGDMHRYFSNNPENFKNETFLKPIYLDKNLIPTDPNALKLFDALIISDFDTSILSTEQISAIEKYIQQGHLLIIDQGEGSSKTLKGFNKNFNLFEPTSKNEFEMHKAFDYNLPVTNNKVNILSGNLNNGAITLGTPELPLSITYKMSKGAITYATFPLRTLAEINPQVSKQIIVQEFISKSQKFIEPFFINNSNPLSNFSNYMINDIEFPTLSLVIIILIYILFIAPITYIVLKMMKKREIIWAIYPLVSILFLVVIYTASLGELKTAPIAKTFSYIDLVEENNTTVANIESSINLINNRKGTFSISYDNKLNDVFKFVRNENSYINYNRYNNNGTHRKINLDSTRNYEFKDFGIWRNMQLLSSKKIENVKPFNYELTLLPNNLVKFTISNSSNYFYKDSFIVLMNNFYYIGDLNVGESKEITCNLDEDVNKNQINFFKTHFHTHVNYQYNKNRIKDLKKSREKMVMGNILSRKVLGENRNNSNNSNYSNYSFFAFNTDNINYELKANGTNPEFLNTNLFHKKLNLKIVKDAPLVVPYKFIEPRFESSSSDHLRNIFSKEIFSNAISLVPTITFTGSSRIQTNPKQIQTNPKQNYYSVGAPFEATFSFEVYKDFETREINLLWEKDRGSKSLLTTMILDVKNDSWVEFDKEFSNHKTHQNFINFNNKILVKIEAKVATEEEDKNQVSITNNNNVNVKRLQLSRNGTAMPVKNQRIKPVNLKIPMISLKGVAK